MGRFEKSIRSIFSSLIAVLVLVVMRGSIRDVNQVAMEGPTRGFRVEQMMSATLYSIAAI